MRQIIYFLSLGSNQGDRENHLQHAITLLGELGEITDISSIYKTIPQDMAPGSEFFFNLVLGLKSTRQPQELLSRIKEIEKQMGRDLTHSHKQPRTIDIDILLADDSRITTPALTIPHPAMINREFVLVPLHEIAPTLVHPEENKSIEELLNRLKPSRMVKKLPLEPDGKR